MSEKIRETKERQQAEAASKDVDESKLSDSHRQMLQTMCGNFDMIWDIPAPSAAILRHAPPLHTVCVARSTWFPGTVSTMLMGY